MDRSGSLLVNADGGTRATCWQPSEPRSKHKTEQTHDDEQPEHGCQAHHGNTPHSLVGVVSRRFFTHRRCWPSDGKTCCQSVLSEQERNSCRDAFIHVFPLRERCRSPESAMLDVCGRESPTGVRSLYKHCPEDTISRSSFTPSGRRLRQFSSSLLA